MNKMQLISFRWDPSNSFKNYSKFLFYIKNQC